MVYIPNNITFCPTTLPCKKGQYYTDTHSRTHTISLCRDPWMHGLLYSTTDVLNLLECNIENDLEIDFFAPLLGMGDAAKRLSAVYLDNRRFES